MKNFKQFGLTVFTLLAITPLTVLAAPSGGCGNNGLSSGTYTAVIDGTTRT